MQRVLLHVRVRISLKLWLIAMLLAAGTTLTAAAQHGEGARMLEAARKGDLATVLSLIDGAGTEMRDGQGRTPLLLATRSDHVRIAQVLIDAGADVNARDAIHDTPFLYAGAEGRDEILKLILRTGKARLSDTNRYGGTALIPAAHHGHPSTVRILLDAGLDVDHVNDLGWTALIEAVILGDGGPVYQKIVGMLVDAGARPIPDRDGATPVEHARRRGFAEIEARLAPASTR